MNILNPKVIILLAVLLSTSPLAAQSGTAPVWTLEQCIDIALQQNPQLQSRELTAQETEARIDEVRAGFYPSVSLNGSTGRYDYDRPTGITGYTSRENYQAGISARYPLFEGFRTSASTDAARANHEATQAQYRQSRSDLRLDVTTAYYRLLQATRLVQVAEQSLQRTMKHLNYAEARLENGLATRSDVLKARVEQSNADLTLIRARNNRLTAAGRLNVLLGREAQLAIRIQDNLEPDTLRFSSDLPADSAQADVSALQPGSDRLINAALQSRQELNTLDHQLKAQQAAVRIARSAYYPSVAVDGNYSYSGDEPSDLPRSSYIGISVSMPLFSGLARPARTAQENLALQNLEQQRKSLEHQISIEVWNAYLKVKEAQERIISNRTFYEDAQENLRIAEGEYKEGVGSMLDVIDAQTAQVSAEESYIEALADFRIARAALKRAVGQENIEEMIR